MMNKFYNKYVALVVPYSIVVSTLYLFGFWSTFDVNVFEYIDLSEIIKIAIFQLSAYGLILVLVSGLTALFLFPIIDRVFTPKNGTSLPRLPEVDFIIRYWRILIALPVLASSLYIAFFTNSPIKWFLAAILISPLVAVVIDSSNFLSDVITNVKLRVALVSVLTTILLCCYGWGTVDAFDIKNKESNVLINDKLINSAYIGRSGEYIFLWDKKSETVEIILAKSVASMKYHIKPQKMIIDWQKWKEIYLSYKRQPRD